MRRWACWPLAGSMRADSLSYSLEITNQYRNRAMLANHLVVVTAGSLETGDTHEELRQLKEISNTHLLMSISPWS